MESVTPGTSHKRIHSKRKLQFHVLRQLSWSPGRSRSQHGQNQPAQPEGNGSNGKQGNDENHNSHKTHSSHQSPNNRPIIPPRGDYQTLLSFQKAEVVYDITFRFAHKYLGRGDRTVDQT